MKNTSIANTHRAYRKFVGYVVAKAAFLAVVTNTLVVPAGLLVMDLSVTNLQHNAWSLLVSVPLVLAIGTLLALIADGMTLGACARVSVALLDRKILTEKFAQVAESTKTPQIKEVEKQKFKLLYPTYWINGICIAFFSCISASAGTLFWHKLLESLPAIEAWIFSTLFSVLISGTLIACELFREQNNEVVRKSIVTDHFTNEALLEDANEEASKVLHDQYAKQIKEIVENTNAVKISVEEHAQRVYDNLLTGGKGLIPARIEREKADRTIAMQRQEAETERQWRLINGEQETVIPIDHSTELIAQETGKNESSDFQKVADLYARFGEQYVRENVSVIAREIGKSNSTVYRYLAKCIKYRQQA